MNTLKITIPLKPISLNNIERSRVVVSGKKTFTTRYKTKEYNDWAVSVMNCLAIHSGEIREFSKLFNPEEHLLETSYRFNLPNLFIKNGKRISKTSMDVDNCVKSLNDIVFSHLKSHNSEIDDSFVCQCIARKSESATVSTEIIISIGSLGSARKVA